MDALKFLFGWVFGSTVGATVMILGCALVVGYCIISTVHQSHWCHAKGGVLVREGFGSSFACIKVEKLEE